MTSSVSTNKLINIVGSSSNTAATIEVNGSTIVLNQDAGSITFTDTVEKVTTDQNQTELKINTEGDTVFFSAQRGWLNYVAGFSSNPVLTSTIATGEVWTYTYTNGVLYRLIPSGTEPDAFYNNFSNGVLGGLVVTKGVTI